MARERSSSPYDPEAHAALEAKAKRLEEKKRRYELEQERKKNSGPKVLVAESPSPRKKRQRLAEHQQATTSTMPAYFDSTMLGPPPSMPKFFKPESSVSITRKEPKESKFSSHESAIPKSFLEKMQNEQQTSKLDSVRREQLAKRSIGFGSLSGAKEGLMKAREGTDMKVRAIIKDSSGAKKKSSEGKERELDEEIMRDVKPVIPAMTRPKHVEAKEEVRRKPINKKRRESSASGEDQAGDESDELDVTDGPTKSKKRNKDGTVIEELEMGPIDFVPPRNDPDFERIEPNSGIKLKQRTIPHEQVQGLLSDRYHLSPSQIYSLARVDNRRQVHIDVDADFVIIGVLAWKDEIRFLNSNPLAEPRKETDEQKKRRARYGEKQDPMKEVLPDGAKPAEELFVQRTKKQRKQRYIRFELVDLSTENAAASGTGTLNVMLVEADTVDTGFDEDGNEIPIYKGQSGGAYEKYWKESPGAVVAIINPHFLPATEGRSHTLKPISADSMVVLGRAKDLTFCDAIRKKDGQKCGSWVDSRVGTKCQYHIHLAVNRTGMGRAETFGNTASLKQTTSLNISKLNKSLRSSHPASSSSYKKPLPLVESSVMVQGHNTYIAGGSKGFTSAGTRAKTSDLSALTAGGIGLPTSRGSGGFIPGVRDGPVVTEEKKKKEREKLDRERGRRELKELGKTDKGQSLGGEYLRMAREQEKERKKREREKEEKEAEKKAGGKKKTKMALAKKRAQESSDESDSEEEEDDDQKKKERRKVFSSEAVRMIGYNPTMRPGDLRDEKEDDETLQQRLALEGGLRHAIKLSAPPGQKVISGVQIDPDTVAQPAKKRKVAPSKTAPSKPVAAKAQPKKATQPSASQDQAVDAEDDDDDDLFIEGAPTERVKISLPRSRTASSTPQPTTDAGTTTF